MTDQLGKGRYEVDADITKVDRAIGEVEGSLKRTGTAAEQALGKQMTSAAGQGAAAVGKFGTAVGKIQGALGKMGAQGGLPSAVLGKMGIGPGLGVMGLATKGLELLGDAVDGVTKTMAGAGRAFNQDRESIESMEHALSNSIPTWKGYRGQIDAAVKDARRLGFYATETRESIAGFGMATGNVTTALRLQRFALDIARMKKISLKQASEAVAGAMRGETDALEGLGFKLVDGVKGIDALTLAMDQATGSAERYATTTGGQVTAKVVELQQKLVNLGATTVDANDSLSEFRLGALGGLLDVMTVVSVATAKTFGKDFPQYFGEASVAVEGLGQTFETAHDVIARNGSLISDQMLFLTETIVNIGEEGTSKAIAAMSAMGPGMADAIRGNKDIVKDAMEDLMWAVKHPAAAAKARVAVIGALTGEAMGEALRSKKSWIREKAQQTFATLYTQAGAIPDAFGNVGAAAASRLMQNLNQTLGTWSIVINGTRVWNGPTGGGVEDVGPQPKAQGGRVAAGVPYLVGERRPEVFVPERAGTIMPSVGSLAQVMAPGRTPANGRMRVELDVTPGAALALRGAGYDEGRVAGIVIDVLGEYVRAEAGG